MWCHSIIRSISTVFFFFNDTATTEIYTLSLHDALPISCAGIGQRGNGGSQVRRVLADPDLPRPFWRQESQEGPGRRSEEHTSELQSLRHLACPLLLDEKT